MCVKGALLYYALNLTLGVCLFRLLQIALRALLNFELVAVYEKWPNYYGHLWLFYFDQCYL